MLSLHCRRYFQLGDVKIPQDVQKRYLLTLTRQLDSEKEKFVQVNKYEYSNCPCYFVQPSDYQLSNAHSTRA